MCFVNSVKLRFLGELIYIIVKTESYLLSHWKLWIFYENSSVVFKSRCQWNLFCSFIQIQIEFLIRTQEFSTRELPGVALVNCAIPHIFTIIDIRLLKQSFLIISPCIDVPYVWDHISEGKACIKNPKTCGPSKWPPLTNGMSYSCGQSVSFEKPRDKRLPYKLVD